VLPPVRSGSDAQAIGSNWSWKRLLILSHHVDLNRFVTRCLFLLNSHSLMDFEVEYYEEMFFSSVCSVLLVWRWTLFPALVPTVMIIDPMVVPACRSRSTSTAPTTTPTTSSPSYLGASSIDHSIMTIHDFTVFMEPTLHDMQIRHAVANLRWLCIFASA
jgi:hypothetical protein